VSSAHDPRRLGILLTGLFFVSGAIALAYEVVWVRALGLVVGNSLWSAIAVVAAYMGGMAAGSALVARMAARLRWHLRWYAGAEAAAALVALGTGPAVELLAAVSARLGPEPLSGWGLPLLGRFAVAWLFLCVPTVAMGATLPLLVERLRGPTALGVRVARLYAANTFGGVAGVVGAAFVGLPLLGERATLHLAAVLGLVVAGVAWLLQRGVPAPAGTCPADCGRAADGWLTFPALFGFVALACELVWTRILILHLGSRVYAFAIILAVYLVGIAAGSALARSWRGAAAPALAVVQAVAAVALALQVILLMHLAGLLGRLAAWIRPSAWGELQLVLVAAVAAVVLLPTMAFGAAFPLAVAAYPGAGGDARRTGAVAAANTVGGIAGAILAPLVLVPWLGSQNVLVLLALASAAAGVALAPRRTAAWALLPAAAPALAVVLLLPPDAVIRGAGINQGEEIETMSESASATVVVRRVEDARGAWLSLELNGVNVAGTSPELRAIQRLQGHLPLLLASRPESVLHIGFGSGGTAWAVAQHPVRRIVIAEISPEVLAVSDTVFDEVNHHVLCDPRVEVVVNDGRNVLLASSERFDVILSDSIHPVYAGNSTLYTREYFELCRQHLGKGGVVSMWLPLYSLSRTSYLAILRAFFEVFPHTCVWYDPVVLNEFTVVTGSAANVPVRIRWDALRDPRLTVTLAEAGVHDEEDLAAMLLLGPPEVASLVARVAAHVDDYPQVEYRSGRLLDPEGSWLINFDMLCAARANRLPFGLAPGDPARALARRDAALAVHRRALQRRIASR
jgi:spermidine synthase